MISRVYNIKNNDQRSTLVKRGLLTVFVVLPVLAVTTALVYVQFFQLSPTVEATYYDLPATESADIGIPWPTEGIAVLGSVGNGILAGSEDADKPVPIASLAKLFAALAILEQKPFNENQEGELISFGPVDEQLYVDTVAEQGSSYPINAGDQLTQYEALQVLLIPSANNMADSLVLWAFGSEQAYLTYVNNMVSEKGLKDTVIADASGLSPDSVSTARDLLAIAEDVLEDPVLASIVRQPQAVIDTAVGTILNTNQLLQEEFVVGVKTGTTDEAGANLIFAAEFPLTDTITETIVAVTLGIPDRQTNTIVSNQILQASYLGFGFVEVVPENTAVGRYDVPWGEDVEIVSNGGITVGGWLGKSYQATVSADVMEPNATINQEVGVLKVVDGEEITSVPVTTSSAISEPSLWWKLLNIFD
jgi:D-alanyl-D-alanine carboxypeptidase (penicillin-binding protein 5/6)